MTSARFWADLTSEAFRGLDGARAIAVLPFAAIEQHGPHLPVSVDRDIVDEVVRRSFAVIDPGLPVLFLPTQAIGKSNEHIAFPGTLTLSAEEATRLTGEMVPIESAPGQGRRMGYTLRVPVGVVCAITPFNSPSS